MTEAVKNKLKSFKLWAIFTAVAVGVWGLAFYWIAQPSRNEKFEVWLGAPFAVKSSVTREIESAAFRHGIKECHVNNYDPSDAYYAQAFGLRAQSVDIYILEKEMAQTIFETGIFAPITFDALGAETLKLDDGENIYGVKFIGDYYIFINSASKKSAELLRDVATVLIKAGLEA